MSVCPHCGYCPHCGQKRGLNGSPYIPYTSPYQQLVWISPQSPNTYGTPLTGGSYRGPESGNYQQQCDHEGFGG